MRIMENRTKPGIPHYLVLIWNSTKPGTALNETVLNGDPLYYCKSGGGLSSMDGQTVQSFIL